MKSYALPLAASLVALASATPDPQPGFFGDMKDAFDGAKSDIQAEASSVRDDWSSAWAAATATSSSAAPTATSLAHNISSLTYPRCTPDASRDWCGVVVGGSGSAADGGSYNVSVTDSACKQVALRSGVRAGGAVEQFSTSVGRWTFGVVSGGGLNMTYEGRNISNYESDWESWAVESWDEDDDEVVIYGGIDNCTAADDEDDTSAAEGRQSVMGLGVVVAAAVGVLGLLM